MTTRGALIIGLLTMLTACSRSATSVGEFPASSTSPGHSTDGAVVRRTDFGVRYKLDGVTEASSAVRLGWNRQLEVQLSVETGSTLVEDERVGVEVVPRSVEAALEAEGGSIGPARLAQLQTMEGPIVAPVSGVLTTDGDTPVIESDGIDVVSELSPIQDLRYQSLTFTGRAVVETVLGPREVECAALWLSAQDAPPSGDDPLVPAASSIISPTVHCRLPFFVETVAGLRAQLILDSETIDDVIVVPVPYVGYDAEFDGYYVRVVDDQGAVTPIPVTVGVTDGVIRVITSELPIGASLVLPEGG